MEWSPADHMRMCCLGGRIVSFDVETTDFPHLPTTRVLEIGAVEIQDGCLTGSRFASYIACDEPSVPGAFDKHQLTVEWLMSKGRPVGDVLQSFLDFIGDSPLLCHGCYHGVNCDEEAINNELQRLSLPKLTNRIIQTTDFFGFVTLQRLCENLGVSSVGAHGALRDAEMLAECFLNFQQGGFVYFYHGADYWSVPAAYDRFHQHQHGTLSPAEADRNTLVLPASDAHLGRAQDCTQKLTPLQRQVLAQLNHKERT